jgi:ubiquinone/menaquinone biosynthesis C-methylase UbiE
MKKMKALHDEVKEFWSKNPYTYGLSSKTGKYVDVGDIAGEETSGRFFDEYMRKVRKHIRDAQSTPESCLARFIDCDSMKGKRCLDIACGLGWATVEMTRAGATVTAIDIAPRSVELCRKHLEYRGLQATVLVMDAQRMEFPDHHFDFIVAWGCLMHMPDTELAISEIYRCLKPEGKVFGYMYNKNSVTYWWHFWFLRGILMGQLVKYRGDEQKLVNRYTDGIRLGGNPLARVYTPKEATEMFRKIGFIGVKFQPWGPPRMLDNFPVSKLPLGKLLPYGVKKKIADKFGWGMVFGAKKPSRSE